MGSSGSGRFSDYPGAASRSGNSGMTGGASGADRCRQAFNVLLEDVGNSDCYAQTKSVPPNGAVLRITFDGKRVFAVDENDLKVGAIPTSHNYLAACLRDGVSYIGVVSLSNASPVPTVYADFTAE